MAKTAAQWRELAVEQAGGKTANSVFEIEFIYGTSGGSFTWEQNGVISEPIDFPPAASAFQAALESVATIGVGGTKVSGQLGGPYRVEMTGANAGQEVTPPSIDATLLDIPQEIEVGVVSVGETRDYNADALKYWNDHADDSRSDMHRFLLVKEDILKARINRASESVDISTGQVNRVEEKSSQRTANLERMLAAVQTAISVELNSVQAGSRRTYGGVMTHRTPSGKPFGVPRRWPY